MRVEFTKDGFFDIEFDKREMRILADASTWKQVTGCEIIRLSLAETFRIMELTLGSLDKLKKSVNKFNTENKANIGIQDMQELLRRSGL